MALNAVLQISARAGMIARWLEAILEYMDQRPPSRRLAFLPAPVTFTELALRLLGPSVAVLRPLPIRSCSHRSIDQLRELLRMIGLHPRLRFNQPHWSEVSVVLQQTLPSSLTKPSRLLCQVCMNERHSAWG